MEDIPALLGDAHEPIRAERASRIAVILRDRLFRFQAQADFTGGLLHDLQAARDPTGERQARVRAALLEV